MFSKNHYQLIYSYLTRHNLYVTGIGENGKVDRAELNGIANDPDSQYAMILQFPSEVEAMAEKVLDALCR